MSNKVTHKYQSHGDHRSAGQSQHEFTHSTACGYVRDHITSDAAKVTCKLCLRALSSRQQRGL